MNKRVQSSDTGKIDWMLLSIYLALVTIGWFMIYAVSYDTNKGGSILSLDYAAGRQIIWLGIAFFVLFFILVFESKIWRTFSYGFYSIGIVLLILVLFFGSVINGQKAWFNFGFFSFQPAEIAKFGTCLALANLLSDYKIKLNDVRSAILAISMILFPPILILFQPDAGSALVFFSFFIVLYREGLNTSIYTVVLSFVGLFVLSLLVGFDYTYLLILSSALAILVYQFQNRNYYLITVLLLAIGGYLAIRNGNAREILIAMSVAVLTLCVLFWTRRKVQFVLILFTTVVVTSLTSFFSNFAFENFLEQHQQERINVWLHPERCDPRGSLYNVLQSKMAIGSGGLTGKGFLNGTLTKLNYVPEQATDFIFCTVGEEHGFIGTFTVIGLYLALLMRLSIIAERQKLNFSRNYTWGVAGILFFHFLVNVGMTMGLLPIIGIPLPFLSHGGSSLIGFTVLIGVVLKLDNQRQTD